MIALSIRTFAYHPYKIPSGSMEPTLLVGDYLFVDKFAYGYGPFSLPFKLPLSGRLFGAEPQRGDVAVFRPPNRPEVDYIKRVIGVPGDTVQMNQGRLYINDVQVDRRFERLVLREDDHRDNVEFRIYTENLPNGLVHQIQEVNDTNAADDTSVFTIPPAFFFMMGDNRDRSSDSRFEVGLVPYEHFIGRASSIFYSIDYEGEAYEFWKWPMGIRYSRLFDGIE